MQAGVTQKAGTPSVIEVQNITKPVSKKGWIIVRVKAFGLNRSEIFTRQGHSPNVQFPIVQGIECVGIIEEDLQVLMS